MLWSIKRLPLRYLIVVIVMIGATIGLASTLIPEQILNRFSLLITGDIGDFSGRFGLWEKSILIWEESPIIGAGAGTVIDAPENTIYASHALGAHNTFLSVLAQEGLIGIVLLIVLLINSGILIWQLEGAERVLWTSILLAWVIMSISMVQDYSKETWLIFGLLS